MNRFIILIIIAWALGGCSSSYPTFYTLSPEGSIPTASGVGIGVGPVNLVEYADRPNLVIQTGPNKIEVADMHLWAGDLDNSISRVLSINIGRELNTGNLQTYPWLRDSEIDYQFSVDIHEFVAGEDGYAHLEATWRVYSLPARKLVTTRSFTGKEPIAKGSFDSMVAAQSKLLGRLSKEMAKRISK